MRELARILKRDGLAYLAWASSIGAATTRDWGYADKTQHGHYRVLGRDFEMELKRIIPHVRIFAVRGQDNATGAGDLHDIMTKALFWTTHIPRSLREARRRQ